MSAAPVLNLGLCGKIPIHNLLELFLETRTGDVLTLSQTKMARTIGGWVYDGAAVLAKYIEAYVIHTDHASTDVTTEGGVTGASCDRLRGRTVLELGAGCGVVGTLMGYYGASVTITDLEPLLPLIQYNIEQNAKLLGDRVQGKALCWGDDVSKELPAAFDYVILANCVYYEGSMELLLQTTCDVSSTETLVLACYEQRSDPIKALIQKWHTLAEKYFDIEDVPNTYYRHMGELDCVRIVKMRKRK